MKDKKKIPKGKGRVVSWMFGGKKYYGRFLRETDTHIFARTHNNKIKKIRKKGK